MGRLIKFEDFKAEDDKPKGSETEEVMGGTPDNPSGCLPYDMQKEMAGPVDDCESVEAEEEEEVNAEQDEQDLEEAKLTDKAQEYVSSKIAKLKEEGYEADQAAAIAFSMARKRGFEVDESMIQEDEESEELGLRAYLDTLHDIQELNGVQVKNTNTETIGYINDDNVSNWRKLGHSVFVASEPDGDRGKYHDTDDLVVVMGETDEAETSDYDAPKDVVKPYDKEDEEKIKKVNEKKPHPRIQKIDERKPNPHMKKHLKGRNELDENVEEEARLLDAPYITNAVGIYAGELRSDADTDEDYDVAAEIRQIGRSMKAEFPNTGDIHLEQVLKIADEQGIEDDAILTRVKEEITYIWNQV